MERPPNPSSAAGEVVCVALGGDADERAARVAGTLARRLSLPLAIIDIRTPVPSSAGVGGGSYAAPPIAPGAWAPEGGWAGPPADLDHLVEEAGAPARCDEIETTPRRALETLCSAPGTRLLVAADEGGGPIAAKLAGAPARDVLREAHCPVVLVPDVAHIELPDTPTIACAVDDDAVAEHVAAYAGELASALGARLRIFHAGDGAEAAEALFERVRTVVPAGIDVAFERLVGDAETLGGVLTELAVALVVVGRPDHGALVSALHGSIPYALLKSPVAPVVVVPDAEHAHPRT